MQNSDSSLAVPHDLQLGKLRPKRQVDRLLDALSHVHWRNVEVELARVNLAEVQNVVDHSQQMFYQGDHASDAVIAIRGFKWCNMI